MTPTRVGICRSFDAALDALADTTADTLRAVLAAHSPGWGDHRLAHEFAVRLYERMVDDGPRDNLSNPFLLVEHEVEREDGTIERIVKAPAIRDRDRRNERKRMAYIAKRDSRPTESEAAAAILAAWEGED